MIFLITKKKILITEQFGFRAKQSTQYQLLRVGEFLSENLNLNIPASAVFLYIAKAFDKVCNEGIIYKLIKLGIHVRLIHLIHFYFGDRTFCVSINNTLSTLYRILADILQSSVFGTRQFTPQLDMSTPITKFCTNISTTLLACAPYKSTL